MAELLRPSRVAAGLVALAAALLAADPARASVSFLEPRALPLPVDGTTYAGVYAVAKGDFDGDGRLDVAVTGSGLVPGGDPQAEHDFAAVLLGNGDGTFQAPVVIDLGVRDTTQPGGLAAADLDGDARLDLVLVAQRTRQLLVLLGNGDGTFGGPDAFDTGADALTDLRLADLDRDGRLDAVAVSMNVDLSARQLAILTGDGHGGFGSAQVMDVGRMPQGLAIADLDGADGPDILVAGRGTEAVEVLLNDGSGGFPATPAAFPARTSPFGLWVADYGDDGKLDVLVPGWGGALNDTCGTGCVALLRGDGRGNLAAPAAEDVWKAEGYVLVNTADTTQLDLNGDLRPDALFGHAGGVNEVTTFLSQPGGGHATAQWVASPGSGLPVAEATSRVDGNNVLGIAAGDFDGDGAPDLVAASQRDDRAGGLSFLRGVPGAPGTFQAPRVFSAPRGGTWTIATRSLSLGDFTGDGRRDLLFFWGGLDTFPGLGNGLLDAAIAGLGQPGSEFYDTLRTGDLDGDGRLDALFLGTDGVQGGNPPRHLVFLGVGDGTFDRGQELFPQAAGAAGVNAALADLDGDLDLDLVVLTAEGGIATRVESWLNGGEATPAFTAGGTALVQASGPSYSSGLAVADLDGDGAPDAVAHGRYPDDLLFLRGGGDGTFQAAVPVASELGQPIDTILAGDLDEDGKPDLVTVGGWGGACVLRGYGDGTFRPRTCYGSAEGGYEGRLADLDGDGHLDLVEAALNGLVVLPGKGDGTLGARQPFATGRTTAAALAVGDLDGDGKPELVAGHGSEAGRHFFTTLVNVSGPLADLALGAARTPSTVHAAEVETLTLTIANRGPDAAAAVTLRSPVRNGMAVVSAAASPGSCAEAGGAVSCALGSVAAGGSATVTLRLRPATVGTHWTTASVTGTTPDPNGADNAASVAVEVVAAQADLRAALTGSPDPVTTGQPLTYTATAANDGPSLATGVSLGLTLPAGAAFVSATPGQGSCAVAGGAVTCALGSLDAAGSASVSVVATPSAAGELAAWALVASAVADPDPADNRADLATTAVAPPSSGGCGCGGGDAGGLSLLAMLAALRRRAAGGHGAPGRAGP